MISTITSLQIPIVHPGHGRGIWSTRNPIQDSRLEISEGVDFNITANGIQPTSSFITTLEQVQRNFDVAWISNTKQAFTSLSPNMVTPSMNQFIFRTSLALAERRIGESDLLGPHKEGHSLTALANHLDRLGGIVSHLDTPANSNLLLVLKYVSSDGFLDDGNLVLHHIGTLGDDLKMKVLPGGNVSNIFPSTQSLEDSPRIAIPIKINSNPVFFLSNTRQGVTHGVEGVIRRDDTTNIHRKISRLRVLVGDGTSIVEAEKLFLGGHANH